MPEGLELRILGPLELLRDGVPIPLAGVKPRQLLATLALRHRRTVAVEHLIEVLWPQDPPRSAVANVHTYVHALRTHLGGAQLRRQPPGYRLLLGPAELDVARFDEDARATDPARLDAALALWRGDPMENLPHSPLWRPEVERLVERWRLLREQRARVRIESGDPAGAIADLRALVTEDPLREEAWRLLVTALDATGRRAEALSMYSSARRFLVEELGIEPSEPLRRLHRSLLTQDAPAAPAGSARLDSVAATMLRGFALLNLGPAPGWVAAALLDRDDAQTVLDNLERGRLVRRIGRDELGQPRFVLSIVASLLAPELPDPADEAMLCRVLGGYLDLAGRAAQGLPAQIFGPGVSVAARWPVPATAELTKDPVAWFTVERQALLAAVDLAARLGRSELAWAFAHAMLPWCDLGGHSAEWEQSHRTALDVCRRTGDLLGEAVSLRGLGQLHLYRDQYGAAAEAFSRARLAYARLGNTYGEAGALAGLGSVHRLRGDHDAAYDCYRQALASYLAVGDRHGQAYVHGALAQVWLARRNPAEALRSLNAGLPLATELDDQHRVAHLLHRLGLVRVALDEAAAARDCFITALGRFTVLGDAHGQAYCLSDLAELEQGAAAITRLGRALEVFEQIGDRRGQEQTARRLGELHRVAGRERLGDAYLAEARRLRSTVEDEMNRAG
ncbi:BTAD domain-containing putative transcriptional regulator [Micromonospora sp. NPDC006431]|uniref:BTAD domain-containing putative transcriptional regulator n=1 Tax=Micromonospora sp. NPDC006431 TaxID=3364235 RepID=UPI0036BC0EB4